VSVLRGRRVSAVPLSACVGPRDIGLQYEEVPTVIDARDDRTGPTMIVLD
jgi:hypothetical protein